MYVCGTSVIPPESKLSEALCFEHGIKQSLLCEAKVRIVPFQRNSGGSISLFINCVQNAEVMEKHAEQGGAESLARKDPD